MDKILQEKITKIANKFVNQEKSHVVVSPNEIAPGFWFGAGNLQEIDGNLILCGRYRNSGDSRTGINMGDRGLEWAAFISNDKGTTWKKIISRNKESLSRDSLKVISIEGSSLFKTENGYALLISTEKSIDYPIGFKEYRKPGTGVWSIDIIESDTFEGLETAPVLPFLQSEEVNSLHIKDPAVYKTISGGLVLLFSHHPYNWASSNTGFVSIENLKPNWEKIRWDFLPRGNSWDVAISRGTSLWNIPKIGKFKDLAPYTLVMYDGGECMLPLKKYSEDKAIKKGYSCEELGGIALYSGDTLTLNRRLSHVTPEFISPYGTGCSRYVSLLHTTDGVYCSWQQSGISGEQALVLNFISNEEINTILS